MLGPGGFDPARDIVAITVNRWPHGYAYTYNSLYDPMEWVYTSTNARPNVSARQPYGRITIANSDAGASPHTDTAFGKRTAPSARSSNAAPCRSWAHRPAVEERRKPEAHTMHASDRDLGMARSISRRDFLNGVGVALTGAVVAPPWLDAYGLAAVGQRAGAGARLLPAGAAPACAAATRVLRSGAPAARRGAPGQRGGHRHRRALRPRGGRRRHQRPFSRALLPRGRRARAPGCWFWTITMISAATPSATSSATTDGCCC